MTKQYKQLLLIDLCARLPYGVKIKFAFNKDIEKINNLIYISGNELSYRHNSCMVLTEDNIKYVFNDWFDECQPYLRPLSSMTEEERKEYKRLVAFSGNPIGSANLIDWLNKKMFAYRTIDDKDMFELGLALPAPEGIYNSVIK